MTSGKRHLIRDLRGVSRLAIDATTSMMDLVEVMHRTIAGGPAVLKSPFSAPARLFLSPIYGSMRGVTRLVGEGIDVALAQLTRLIDERAPIAEQEAVLAALNGVLGDYLVLTHNPLAIEMCLRRNGEVLPLEHELLSAAVPDATGRVVVFAHGCCMSDLQWTRDGYDYGALLSDELGFTVVHLVYNSGLHISDTGEAFAALLERLVAAWPVPIDELSIVGHSMGGLVARSACHLGDEARLAWRGKLRRLVCLGSPHHGAVLEQGGNFVGVLLGVSRYSAPFARLARIRSAGVTDLRYGNVRREDWAGRDRFAPHGDGRLALPLPDGVESFLVAGTLTPGPDGPLRGDGLVSVDSALGRHERPELTLALPESHRYIAYGTGHLGLLSSRDVYGALCNWFSA